LRASADAKGRRARGARVGAPYLVPSALALAAALALWAGWGRLTACTLPAALDSPETQVRTALSHQHRAHLADVYGFRAGGTAELVGVKYGDVAVSTADRAARVVAVVEADGRVAWRDEVANLSYVGRERFTMTPCSIALWCGDGDQFARLRGALTLLFRREDAFNARDAAAYGRLVSDAYRERGGKAAVLARIEKDLASGPPARVRILAWQVKIERDGAVVGEDYELRVGDGPARRLRARYELGYEGDRWRIVGGL
jgi:hypothetical protein